MCFRFQKVACPRLRKLKETALHSKQAEIFKNPFVRDRIAFSCYGGIGVFSKTENSIRETGLVAVGETLWSQQWGNTPVSRERLEENTVLKMG